MKQAEPVTPQDFDALAGELTLGLLEGDDRAAALRLMLADRDFARRVEAWRADTSGMFDAIDEIEPPHGAWNGIAARVGGRTSAAATATLRWWRAGALGAGALAATLAFLLVVPRAEPVASPFAVAQLTGSIEGLRIATRYDPATATLRVRAVGMPSTQTEPELWILPPAGGAPVSLGQIARDGETVIAVVPNYRPLIGGTSSFALTMEPRSDRPSAAPTGDIVANGAIDLI